MSGWNKSFTFHTKTNSSLARPGTQPATHRLTALDRRIIFIKLLGKIEKSQSCIVLSSRGGWLVNDTAISNSSRVYGWLGLRFKSRLKQLLLFFFKCGPLFATTFYGLFCNHHCTSWLHTLQFNFGSEKSSPLPGFELTTFVIPV